MRIVLFMCVCLITTISRADDRTITPDAPLTWWRGNLHTHTLWSDGDGFPEMVAEWYRDNGYHFLALSDHNVLSQGLRWMSVRKINERARANAFNRYLERFGRHWVETRGEGEDLEVRLKPFDEYRSLVEERNRFLMIPAEEITTEAENKKAVHLNATNLIQLITPTVRANARETIAANLKLVQEQAALHGREILVHVNHPNYNWGITAEDLAAVVDESFFEVWNGVDNDNDPGDDIHPSTDEIWDIANTLRIVAGAPPLMGLATDDSHNYQGTNTRAITGRGWVMVRARHLTPESIIRSIRAGDFYASTGVTLQDIHYDAQSRRLRLSITPQADEMYVTQFIGTRRGANVVGKPRLDPEGRVVETTLDYSSDTGPQIGEVLAEVKGTSPEYVIKGDELYVRAIVVSSAATEVHSREYEFKRAWTQPVVPNPN